MKRIILAIMFVVFLCGKTSLVYPAFNLSVRPYEGGYELKFGKVDSAIGEISKEVTVNIISDLGKPYRLIQSLLEPLTNQEGVSIPVANFFVSAVRASNRYGNLAVEQPLPVSLGRTILYTSSSQGLSDSFTLIYILKGPLLFPRGTYRGRLAFSLESNEPGQVPVTVIMNMSLDLSGPEAIIKISGLSAGKTIVLNPFDPHRTNGQLSFEIPSALWSMFNIYQLITGPFTSSAGDMLPLEMVEFFVSENKVGKAVNTATPLSLQQMVVYNSNLKGDADSFLLNYQLKGDILSYKAGRYRSQVKYFLETADGALKLIDTYNLEIDIPSVFNLDVKTQTGLKVIEFRDVKPSDFPHRFEIQIVTKSNLGRQYQISQNLTSELVNREGKSIPLKFFTLRTEGLEGKGYLQYPNSTPVKLGEMVLFVSDKVGSPVSFRIIYELSTSWDIPAGDYSAPVVYSISEL